MSWQRLILVCGTGYVAISAVAIALWGAGVISGLVVLGLLVVLFLIEYPQMWDTVAERRLARGCCLACGYDLRGSAASDACPECGAIIPDTIRKRWAREVR